MLKVYFSNVTPLFNESAYLKYYQLMPKFRKEKADKYIKIEDKIRSVASFYLLTKLLKDNHIKYHDQDFKIDENNKPYLKQIYFNLSHSGDFVFAAISDHPVGVDVQKREKVNIDDLKDYVLNEKEKSQEISLNRFFKIWTKKESYLKCLGKGLIIPMKTISNPKGYNFYYFNKNNHQFAICIKGKSPLVKKAIKLL